MGPYNGKSHFFRWSVMPKKQRKPKQEKPEQEVSRQPLSRLPLIAHLIDEGVKDAENQHRLLEEGKEKPHVFDDALISRVQRLYDEKLEFAGIYAEQLERWKKTETLTMDEHFEIQRLAVQVKRMDELSSLVLSLAEEIEKGTIDKIMEMDDAELGLRFLLGDLK